MSKPDLRSWERGSLPQTQKLALAAVLVALGTVLGAFSIPIGPARIAPFQHTINVLAGILLGPWYALLTAFAISVLRNAFGVGTFLAFPGSMIGAWLVGVGYHYIRRTDAISFLEPVGTALIGGTVGYLLIAPLTGTTLLLGFIKASPPAPSDGGAIAGVVALILSFASASIPGSILGFIVVRALHRAGLGLEAPRVSRARVPH